MVSKRSRRISAPIFMLWLPFVHDKSSAPWNRFSMFRFGPPEPDRSELLRSACRGPRIRKNDLWKQLHRKRIHRDSLAAAKLTPACWSRTSRLPLCRVYPNRSSFTKLGVKICTWFNIELIELLMLFVPPPKNPLKLPGFTLDCNACENRP